MVGGAVVAASSSKRGVTYKRDTKDMHQYSQAQMRLVERVCDVPTAAALQKHTVCAGCDAASCPRARHSDCRQCQVCWRCRKRVSECPRSCCRAHSHTTTGARKSDIGARHNRHSAVQDVAVTAAARCDCCCDSEPEASCGPGCAVQAPACDFHSAGRGC